MCNTVYCGLIHININTDVQENVQIGCTGYVHIAAVWMMENNGCVYSLLNWVLWMLRCYETEFRSLGEVTPPQSVGEAWILLRGTLGSGQNSELGTLPSDSMPNTHKLYSVYYMEVWTLFCAHLHVHFGVTFRQSWLLHCRCWRLVWALALNGYSGSS